MRPRCAFHDARRFDRRDHFGVIVLSLMLLLWMNDRRQEMGVLVSLGIGKHP